MAKFYEDLAKMLRVIRLKCGFSQKEVALGLGIQRSTYTYYESGKTKPDLYTVLILSKIFDIPLETFFYPEEFATINSDRRRAPKKVQPLDNIGSLSAEEKKLIAKLRAGTKK